MLSGILGAIRAVAALRAVNRGGSVAGTVVACNALLARRGAHLILKRCAGGQWVMSTSSTQVWHKTYTHAYGRYLVGASDARLWLARALRAVLASGADMHGHRLATRAVKAGITQCGRQRGAWCRANVARPAGLACRLCFTHRGIHEGASGAWHWAGGALRAKVALGAHIAWQGQVVRVGCRQAKAGADIAIVKAISRGGDT